MQVKINLKKLLNSLNRWESRTIIALHMRNASESAINSIMMISRTIMVESGLGSRFWFKSAMTGCEARNVTHKERIGTTPWRLMHGNKRMYPDFAHSLGGHGFISTKKEEKTGNIRSGQWRQSTLDSNLTQARNHSSFRKEHNNVIQNQAQFDERVFPFRKKKMVEQYQSDDSTDILFQSPSDVK
jgi:hypothetical protein